MRRSGSHSEVDGRAVRGEDVASLRSWHRTGLVSGWAAVALLVGAVGWWLTSVPGRTGPEVLAGAAVLCALVAHVYLSRVRDDPGMVDRPSTVPMRRLSTVATCCWGTVLLLSAYVAVEVGDVVRPGLLVGAATVLGCVAAACFVALLALAGRQENRP